MSHPQAGPQGDERGGPARARRSNLPQGAAEVRRVAAAWRGGDASTEYARRHGRTPARRLVTAREVRIVIELLAAGGFPASPRTEPAASRPGGMPPLLLDAPCGAGRVAAGLHAAGLAAIGLDSSEDMVRLARGEGALEPDRAVAGSLTALPFAERAFGAAVCIRLLHHLAGSPDRRDILAEIRRVTDGPLVVSAWTGPSLQGARRRLRRALGRRPSARYSVPRRVLTADLEAAGWRLLRVRHLLRWVCETAYFLAT